ncbi:hypothetical protein J6590_010946 [Homalodisca vitripennis]|nr:hypothetical protein J6590_010946 [Homalodisca vitripennis]
MDNYHTLAPRAFIRRYAANQTITQCQSANGQQSPDLTSSAKFHDVHVYNTLSWRVGEESILRLGGSMTILRLGGSMTMFQPIDAST